MTSSKGFQYHFSIISKFICCDCYMKKNVAFTHISFAVLKWHECLSFQLPFELTVEIPVQLHLELEVNLLVHNVIEREIEREKVQMKPPRDLAYKIFFRMEKLSEIYPPSSAKSKWGQMTNPQCPHMFHRACFYGGKGRLWIAGMFFQVALSSPF